MPALTVVRESTEAEADKKFGYAFGCDGVLSLSKAREMLGEPGRSSVERRIKDGLIRGGKDGGRVVICRRSLMNYIATLES